MNGKYPHGTPIDKEAKIKKVERGVLSLLLALVVGAAAFIGGWFGRWAALGKNKQSLLEAIDTAKERYYQDIDEDALYKSLFSAFEFDRYSAFYTAKDYEKIAAEREGQNRDAGFSVFSEESYLQIYAVLEGSSAEEKGLEAGMYFFKYGKTKDDLKTGNAENYFSFVSSLKEGETYFVLCGTSERMAQAQTYEVTNRKEGAGIALTRKYAPMRIYQVVGNSAADHAGLKRGMYILKFGASETELTVGTSSDLTALISKLTPDQDGNVTFYLQCSFDQDATDAPVKAITTQSYQASYCLYRDSKESYRFWRTDEGMKPVETQEPLSQLNDKTAYIALSEFTGNAAKEFKTLLAKMKERGRTDLILDLRGNGGGYMDVFVDIASYMLKDATSGAQKVAYAQFRNGATVSYSAKSSSFNSYFEQNSHVYILADEYTASASECLIGALVDYGTVSFSDIFLHENAQGVARTYGKGIMQTYYDVSNGNQLKLTSAQIFWPKSGKTIHDVGVSPTDGAQAIASPLLPDEQDAFLQEAIERIQRVTTTPSAPSGSY